ncbi:hypothetical protein [Vibrio phage vB_VpaS_VP-RY-9]|nr:hypothetical protein [Vibrio phage vB_VpaS_VP-RY-9]
MNIKAIPTNEVKLLSVYLMVSKDTMLTREGAYHTVCLGAPCLDEDGEDVVLMLLGDEEPRELEDFIFIKELHNFDDYPAVSPHDFIKLCQGEEVELTKISIDR